MIWNGAVDWEDKLNSSEKTLELQEERATMRLTTLRESQAPVVEEKVMGTAEE
jgi:hypothetical protein